MKKVLIAEDDSFLSSLLIQDLKVIGFDLMTAFDGNEALERIHSWHPDMILLDLVMPNKDGFAVMEELHKDTGEASKIPILVLSNLSKESDVAKAKQYGAVDFMVKANTTPHDIAERIKKILS